MISPAEVEAWLILLSSTGSGLVAAGTLVYSRVHHVRLDAEALEEIHRANRAAIQAGQKPPFPEWLPAARVATG